MDYKKFTKEAPIDTKTIFNKAIEVFSAIKDKDLISFSLEGIYRLKKEDKIVISLTLAGLLVDGYIKDIYNENGVTAEKIFKYFRIDKNTIIELPKEVYAKTFQNEFRDIIERLQKFFVMGGHSSDINDFSNFEAERIFRFICQKFLYYSSILNRVYNATNIDVSFDSCQRKSDAKKTEAPKNNKENINPNLSEFMKRLTKDLIVDESVLKAKEKKSVLDEANNLSNLLRKAMTEYSVNPTSLNKKQQNTSKRNLSKYGDFLTGIDFKTNPAIGREEEIKNLMLALVTPEKSAIIVGDAGVGKTAIVEGLAYFINKDHVPNQLKNKKIVRINVSSIMQGCMFVGMLEERMEQLMKELIESPDTILFIDEIHNVIGAGTGSRKQVMDIANILKPYLDRGQIKMIGATTTDEYEKHIMNDSAFKRRFERVNVKEPDETVVKRILSGSIPIIEEATNVKFNFNQEEKDFILNFIASVTSSKNRLYFDQVNNPDLALTILKKAFAYASLYDFKYLEIEHIAEAIKTSERIDKNIRDTESARLLATFNNHNEIKEKPIQRTIPFPRTGLK